VTCTLRTITITRRGEVNWRVTGLHHCGPSDQVRSEAVWRRANQDYWMPGQLHRPYIPVRYVVVVVCAPRLDERGFLFDQVTMADYMAKLADQETDLSCERLCDRAATTILEKLKTDAPACRVRSLTMTLSPAPHVAEVTAQYLPARAPRSKP
jgi:hypothetical protein